MEQAPLPKQCLKEKQAHIRNVITAEWQKIKNDNPALSNWEIKPDIHCYKKRPPGFHLVINRIMETITTPQSRNPLYAHIPAGADKTQTQILAEIRPSFSNHNIQPNVWNRPLTKQQITKLKRLGGNFQQPINLAGCKTLAQAKKRIQAALHASDATSSFKGTITIDNDKVVVGKQVYSIEKRTASGHEYPSIRVNVGGKRSWLRVDLLRSLLT
jgi:hypothetical protein